MEAVDSGFRRQSSREREQNSPEIPAGVNTSFPGRLGINALIYFPPKRSRAVRLDKAFLQTYHSAFGNHQFSVYSFRPNRGTLPAWPVDDDLPDAGIITQTKG